MCWTLSFARIVFIFQNENLTETGKSFGFAETVKNKEKKKKYSTVVI